MMRMAKLVPPLIENKLQLISAVKNLESHFNTADDKTDDEEDEYDFVM